MQCVSLAHGLTEIANHGAHIALQGFFNALVFHPGKGRLIFCGVQGQQFNPPVPEPLVEALGLYQPREPAAEGKQISQLLISSTLNDRENPIVLAQRVGSSGNRVTPRFGRAAEA